MSDGSAWPLAFEKYSGAGNDFLLLDVREDAPPGDPARLARALCRRGHSVGADGLILLDRPEPDDGDAADAAIRMRLWNADGTPAEISGNGARCVARWVVDRGMAGSDERIVIASDVGALEARVDRDSTRLRMPVTALVWPNCRLRVEGKDLTGTYVEVGVPFFVCFHERPEDLAVRYLGRAIRRHQDLAPRGANVDFVRVDGEQSLFFRVYERGVEDETLSSGTGSISAALAAAAAGKVTAPVSCVARGATLLVRFRLAGDGDATTTGSESDRDAAGDEPATFPWAEGLKLQRKDAVPFTDIEVEGDARRVCRGEAFAGAARTGS